MLEPAFVSRCTNHSHVSGLWYEKENILHAQGILVPRIHQKDITIRGIYDTQ